MKKRAEHVLAVCCILAAVVVLVRRIFGIDITDEAYYAADAINTLKGNYPFAYNFSTPSGMNLVTAPIVMLYKIFVPDLSGLILFLRITFILFRLLVLFISYMLLRKTHKSWVLLAAILSILSYHGSVIAAWSYNTIPVWLVFLTGIILAAAFEKVSAGMANKKCLYISAVLSGILISLAELVHPLNFLTVVFFGIMILVFSPSKSKIKAVLFYAGAGVLNTLAIFGSIASKTGINSLLTGLSGILSTGTGAAKKVDRAKIKFLGPWFAYRYLWIGGAVMVAVFILVCFLISKKRKNKTDIKQTLHLAAPLLISGSVGAIGAMVFIKVTTTEFFMLGAAVIVPFLCIIVFHVKKPLVLFMSIPQILFCLTEIWMTGKSDPIGRLSYLIPIFFVIFISLLEDEDRKVRVLSMVSACIVACFLMMFDYVYVYRDVKITEMNYVMPSGIYKGLYTDRDRGEDVLELEQYIHEITDEDEWIKFCDTVPFAYLFNDGKVCDLKAWDILNYAHRTNSTKKMYKYFKNRGVIPDKIIYIDRGADEQLSIEDPDWKFNKFVHAFYEFSEERILNSTYRIKIYLRTGEYEDYLEWSEPASAG